jgi:4-hydroxy-tetrahydrodipicolinate synthase
VRLSGSMPALVTPLDAERRLDLAGLEALVRRAVDDRASGVLACGSTGEGTLLEPEDRAAVTRAARAALGSDGVLLACASAPNVPGLHADVARLGAAGADAVLVLAPAIQPLAPEELVDLHLEVAERAEVPTLAYHIPQYTGSALTPDAVRDLAGHPRVVGMKDSSPDAERRAAFVAAVRDVDGFDVLTGHAPSLQAALEAGASGSITAIANVRQQQVVRLHEAVAAGDTGLAEQLQTALTRASGGIDRVGVSVPAVLKAALQLDGVLEERWCVPPLRSVPPGRLDHVRTALLP